MGEKPKWAGDSSGPVLLEKLNVFKSAGSSDMHRGALKDLAHIIAEALANYHAQGVKRAE